MIKVELSVNTYVGDLPFFEQTYRHLARQLENAPLLRRRIVVDRRRPTGRFESSHSMSELDQALDRLSSDGVVEAIDDVDWSPAEVKRVASKYFGRPDAPPVASGGSAIHQYLWAINTSSSSLILHFDSDMLIHDPHRGEWVAEAIEMMRRNPSVVAATALAGPPRAESLRDWILGESSLPLPRQPGWTRAGGISTRTYLLDRDRLESALPLQPTNPGELLERTLTGGLAGSGLERWYRNSDDAWAIHPRRHNSNHVKHVDGLIGLVERGRYPFRRTGYRWDIRTEGRHFIPWRLMLAFDALRQ